MLDVQYRVVQYSAVYHCRGVRPADGTGDGYDKEGRETKQLIVVIS